MGRPTLLLGTQRNSLENVTFSTRAETITHLFDQQKMNQQQF